jgi:hypothetical protein
MNHIFRSVLLAGAACLLANAVHAAPAKPADVVKEKAQIDAGLDKAWPHLEAL